MIISGGAKLEQKLLEIAAKLGTGATLKVGFLENATYAKNGMPVATIALIQEFGAPAAGIPPRPFFRNFIAKNSKGWPGGIANQLKLNGYDVQRSLQITGFVLKGQLQLEIRDLKTPPNAPSTIRRKGFDDPLIETGHMLNSVDFEID